MERWKQYVALCRQVRKVVKCGREKWWDAGIAVLEEEMRQNRQEYFFKKLNRLNGYNLPSM